MLQFSRQVKAGALAGQGPEEREHAPVFAKEEEKMKRQKLARLQTLATALNFPLTPLSGLMRLVSGGGTYVM